MDPQDMEEATKDFEERVFHGNLMGAAFTATFYGHKYQDCVLLTGVYTMDGAEIPLPAGKHWYETADDGEHAAMMIFRATLP